MKLVVFVLEGNRFALRLDAVERVVPAAACTPLPRAPRIVLGIINVAGRIMPVIALRRRFGLPHREMELSDQLILARTAHLSVALLVDSVSGVLEIADDQIMHPEAVVPGTAFIAGIARTPDGIVFIHDLDSCLSLEETAMLSTALSEAKV